MYTVLRFSGQADKIDELGHRINVFVPGMYTGPDRIGNRFSCMVSDHDCWEEHRDALQNKIYQLTEVIEQARSLGFILHIDVAIEPEDYKARWITEVSLDQELLRLLEHNCISIILSVYGKGGSQP
jgi:hypothetical protein